VLHAYIDESYCDDWFYMVAAIGNDSQMNALERRLDEVADYVARGTDVGETLEFHGYELFQGAGPWKAMPRVPDRLAVAARLFRAIESSGVEFVVRGLDRTAQRARYREVFEPYPLVLTHIIRQINRTAQERAEQVRITCDEIHHNDRHRAMLEQHRQTGTPGYDRSTLGHVVDALEFVSSEDSRMVQAADLLAYLVHRIASKPDVTRAERRARAHLRGIVSHRVIHEFCWVP